MAITLTVDPIISIADLKQAIAEMDDINARLLINAVSAKFLRFTGRVQINSVELTEWIRGDGGARLWLHASPVDTEESVEVAVYDSGELEDTLTLDDGDISVVNLDVASYLYYGGGIFPHSEAVANLAVTYTGGWSTVPGDIVMAAIEQIRSERNRMQGNVGVESVSRDGETARYETSGLLKAVADAWSPYRVVI